MCPAGLSPHQIQSSGARDGREGGRERKRGEWERGWDGEREGKEKRERWLHYTATRGCKLLEGAGNKAVSLIVKFSLSLKSMVIEALFLSHDQIYIT